MHKNTLLASGLELRVSYQTKQGIYRDNNIIMDTTINMNFLLFPLPQLYKQAAQRTWCYTNKPQ